MNVQEKLQLESEVHFLQERLLALPACSRLMKRSVESRISQLEEILNNARVYPSPTKARLTYRGLPVVGSHGVFAEFGLRATTAFTNAVSTVAASRLGPLSSSGKIPNRDQCQLLITSTAVGSFGFELEEHRPGRLPYEQETNASDALELTQRILEASAHGTDDELADSISESCSRAIDAVRSFVEVLSDNDAVCSLVIDEKPFRFQDLGEVRACIERLSQESVKETNVSLSGEFTGCFPHQRTFEFVTATGGEVIRGKILGDVENIEMINSHLRRRVMIQVLETRVRDGKPRYKLMKLPEWPMVAE